TQSRRYSSRNRDRNPRNTDMIDHWYSSSSTSSARVGMGTGDSAARTKSAAYGSRTSGSGRLVSTALAAATPSAVMPTPDTMSQSRNSPAMSAPLSPGNRSITSRTSVYLASTTIRDTDHRSRHL